MHAIPASKYTETVTLTKMADALEEYEKAGSKTCAQGRTMGTLCDWEASDGYNQPLRKLLNVVNSRPGPERSRGMLPVHCHWIRKLRKLQGPLLRRFSFLIFRPGSSANACTRPSKPLTSSLGILKPESRQRPRAQSLGVMLLPIKFRAFGSKHARFVEKAGREARSC